MRNAGKRSLQTDRTIKPSWNEKQRTQERVIRIETPCRQAVHMVAAGDRNPAHGEPLPPYRI